MAHYLTYDLNSAKLEEHYMDELCASTVWGMARSSAADLYRQIS